MNSKNSVVIFTRKKPHDAFSVEMLSATIFDEIKSKINVNYVQSRFSSTSFGNRIKILHELFFVDAKVVHIFGDITYAAIARIFRPTIITILDLNTLYRLTGIKKFMYFLFWVLIPSIISKKIILISEQIKEELIEILPMLKNKVVVIPCHLNPCLQFNAPDNFTHGNKFTVLHIGTTSNKNLSTHIDALIGIDVRLIIVGFVEEYLIEKMNKHSFDYAVYNGLSINELSLLYHSTDLLLFCSTYEGFGMPIIEAQAFSVPVITSNISSMPAVAGGAAILVNPFDVNEIRCAVKKIISDKDISRELSIAGKENSKQYQIGHISKSYISLYRSLI